MKIIPTQDLTAKIKENEEEIAQLRKHLADYSLKVAFFFFFTNGKYFIFVAFPLIILYLTT